MTTAQPSAAFWITVALVAVLVGYPLSFGPACWLADDYSPHGFHPVAYAYRPFVATGWGRKFNFGCGRRPRQDLGGYSTSGPESASCRY